MDTIKLERKLLTRTVSFLLAMIMCLSCGIIQVFADGAITNGEWIIDNAAEPRTAKIQDLNFTYYSPGTDFIYGNSGDKNYVRSTNSNGSASNGIVTTQGKGYCEFIPEKDGTLTVYVGNASTKTGYVSYIDKEGKANAIGSFIPGDKADVETDNFKVTQGTTWATVEIEVESGCTYHITLSGSKMFCYGAEFAPYTEISGNIINNVGISDYGVKFTNSETEQIKEAVVDTVKSTYTIKLKPGYTYSASLTGSSASSYTFSSDTRKITPEGETMTANLTVEECVTYNVTGSIKGFEQGYDLSDFGLKFVPKDVNDFATITAEIDKTNLTYSAQLVAEQEYSLVKTGANDYELAKDVIVNNPDSSPISKDAEFKTVAVYSVTGGFIGLTQQRGVYEDLNVNVSALTFTNVDDNYVYNANVTNNGYSVSLRDGSYIANITCDDYSTTTHVVVENAGVDKNLLLKYEGKVVVDYADTIFVGADKDYKTVQAAVDAVSNMSRPNGEGVTIKIDPGKYREQVHITVPNITLESNGGDRNDTIITWYYGIGYKYYSSVNSYYNPYADYDKYEKGDVEKYWGAAVITDATATGFSAKGICFENSFNKYMTEEELTDGVEVNGKSINFVRKENTNADSRAATERAAAYVNYADKTEFFECGFIGSQDTLYTCNKAFKAYYKNCYIEGQTDFIYGDGDVFFDGCEINWCGYDGTDAAGYLTAQSSDPSRTAGYVFRNCLITGNKERNVIPGYLGRMWGKGATVNFINTQVASDNYLAGEGWTAMSGTNPTDSTVNLKEYNTTYNGVKVDTSKRVAGAVDTLNFDDYTVESVFADAWTPKYYSPSGNSPEIITGPAFTSNGDLNAPNPGETVTANFTINDECVSSDASRISWYAVDTDYDSTSLDTILQKSTLLYTTASYSTTRFQIPMECAGKYIMAVVTPIVIGGSAEGTPKYIIAKEKPISNTWSNPDNEGEIAPGSGINIFLAGDSTVKDYSANGIYNGGKITNSGSWGEFLQDFFDKELVTINNYAQGGRSTRSFINEGKLATIEGKISEGDYLFVQFGHNDCANGLSYYAERFAPLYAKPNGADVVDGVYPTVLPDESLKSATPDAYKSQYGDTYFSWDCGATYKGYLQAYINVAVKAGAIPVIVSPVSRMYYTSDGKIKTHHDANMTDYEPTKAFMTENDAYVTACEQIYEENKAKGIDIYYIDAYGLTKELFEEAWQDCSSNKNGAAIMGTGDSTHCNKTGGIIEAGLIAKWIQDAGVSASEFVVAPTTVYGENADGNYIFTVKNKEFKAFDNDYALSDYWTDYGQELFDIIAGTYQPETYVYGDADGDGKITENDVLEIFKKVLNNDYVLSIESNRKYKKIIDVDGDSAVTATDSSIVKKKSKDDSYKMPVEK